MRPKIPAIVPLAAALAALGVAPAQADQTSTKDPVIDPVQRDQAAKDAVGRIDYRVDENLFGMTVHRASDGQLFAQHYSHSSHASHASHRSHYSSR